ncbi:MAG: hypothetical protein MJZ16_04720, partial [Bacteroidales bacterium]|nr:hypothetical protein [Bacteroidales bacterium]
MIPLTVYTLSWAAASLGLESILLLAFLVYVLFLAASKLNLKILRISAILIFMSGVLLYMYGFSMEHSIEGWSTILIRSVIASAAMFVSHHELIEIEMAQHTPYFLDLFIFVFACAVATSISAMLSLFGKRTMTLISLGLQKRNDIKYDHVFFSFDENSLHLAENLDKDQQIAFIEFPSDEEVEKISFGALIQNVLEGVMDKYGLDSKNVSIFKASKKISEIDPSKGVLKQIGLGMLEHVTDENTCFYLLSDNKDSNMRQVLTLVKDEYFRRHTIQVNVVKDGLTEQFQNSLFDTHVHFFYRNATSVLTLRDNKDYHPIEVLTVAKDKDGKALGYVEDESLDAMIFAFGAGGKAALRYLFNYSSFVRKDGTPLHLKCYVQDSIIDLSSGSFRASLPHLPHDKDIIYEKVELLSVDFWAKLRDRLDDLKIVFFCTSTQQLNMEAAGAVLDYAHKHRKNSLKNFKVFVRVDETNDNVKAICDFYNWRAGGVPCLITYGDKKELFSPKWAVSGYGVGFESYSVQKAEKVYYAFHKAVGKDAPSWSGIIQKCNEAKQKKAYLELLDKLQLIR